MLQLIQKLLLGIRNLPKLCLGKKNGENPTDETLCKRKLSMKEAERLEQALHVLTCTEVEISETLCKRKLSLEEVERLERALLMLMRTEIKKTAIKYCTILIVATLFINGNIEPSFLSFIVLCFGGFVATLITPY
jgi:hypothetical protein